MDIEQEHVVDLGRWWRDTPEWWHRFIKTLEGQSLLREEDRVADINQVLAAYGAVFEETDSTWILRFKNNASYTHFALVHG
jgi:hypothetical protein